MIALHTVLYVMPSRRLDDKNKNGTDWRMKTDDDLIRYYTVLAVLCEKCSNSALLNNCFLSMHRVFEASGAALAFPERAKRDAQQNGCRAALI